MDSDSFFNRDSWSQLDGTDATEHIISLLADAETEEELLIALTVATNRFNHNDKKAHDLEVQDGVAHALIQTLTRSLQSVDTTSSEQTWFGQPRALQLSILCNALEMVLRCSSSTLKDYMDGLSGTLFPALGTLTKLFLSFDTTTPIPAVALSSIAKMLKRLANHVSGSVEKLASAAIVLLNQKLPFADIRVDAACAIATLVSRPSKNDQDPLQLKLLTSYSTTITTLTTAIRAEDDVCANEVGEALYGATSKSMVFRCQVAKRTDTVRALLKAMAQEGTRMIALKTISALLCCQKCLHHFHTLYATSGKLLLCGISRIGCTDQNKVNQLMVLSTMEYILKDDDPFWTLDQLDPAIDRTILMAFSSQHNVVRLRSARLLCRKGVSGDGDVKGKLQPALVRLLRFPVDKIRIGALEALRNSMSVREVGHQLLTDTTFCERVSAFVRYGSELEQTEGFRTLQTLSFDPICRLRVCKNDDLLGAIVETLVEAQFGSRETYMIAAEILLSLMEDVSQMKCFLAFPDLLPWLTSFANSIPDENELKASLRNSIIQLTTCILENKEDKGQRLPSPTSVADFDPSGVSFI